MFRTNVTRIIACAIRVDRYFQVFHFFDQKIEKGSCKKNRSLFPDKYYSLIKRAIQWINYSRIFLSMISMICLEILSLCSPKIPRFLANVAANGRPHKLSSFSEAFRTTLWASSSPPPALFPVKFHFNELVFRKCLSAESNHAWQKWNSEVNFRKAEKPPSFLMNLKSQAHEMMAPSQRYDRLLPLLSESG